MTNSTPKARLICVLVCICTALLLSTGCSAFKSKKAPSTGPTGSRVAPQAKNIYLDFGDVLLPRQLKVDRDDSFVFSTSGFTAGLLSLRGNVEVNSLLTYFENKMPVDGWQKISAIKSSRSMLLFKKQARWCVISITEGSLNTNVKIWVAPTMDGADPGLLKP